jgi:hypothetical protein
MKDVLRIKRKLRTSISDVFESEIIPKALELCLLEKNAPYDAYLPSSVFYEFLKIRISEIRSALNLFAMEIEMARFRKTTQHP